MFDKNYVFLGKIFLELISSNVSFKNEFQAVAPQIYADIESASKNPNCSCRSKIEAYVRENKDQSVDFLNGFISRNNITIDRESIEQKYKINTISGEIREIKIKEWKEFSNKLMQERYIFRSFSVLPIDSETVKVFFL